MKYEFTADWFAGNEPQWRETLIPAYAGKPGLRFIEIGSYEGRSAVWLVDNVLTGKDCRLFCVDPWEAGSADFEGRERDWGSVEARFDRNVAACRDPGVVVKLKCYSSDALRAAPALADGAADFVYIDGSHEASAVMTDAVRSWCILKPGGLLLFDDYHWERTGGGQNIPRTAIAAFLAIFREQLEVHKAGNQVWIRKVPR